MEYLFGIIGLAGAAVLLFLGMRLQKAEKEKGEQRERIRGLEQKVKELAEEKAELAKENARLAYDLEEAAGREREYRKQREQVWQGASNAFLYAQLGAEMAEKEEARQILDVAVKESRKLMEP